MTIEKSTKDKGQGFGLLLFLLFIVVALWLAIPTLSFKLMSSGSTAQDMGTFGDAYGSTNALFAGLAFAGLIWTIIQQQSEIKLQRKMFKAQLDEQIEARKSMGDQAAAQLNMIKAINTLTSATSIQAQIARQVALLQFTNERISDMSSSENQVVRIANQAPYIAEADRIKETLLKLSVHADFIDPNPIEIRIKPHQPAD